MHVMLIDDDTTLRQTLARVLGAAGVHVWGQADDGQAALAMLQNPGGSHPARPNLIITDCQMPHMDGISLVRALRDRGDNTPILMVSGLRDERVIAAAFAAGVNHYATKPLNVAGILETISQTFTASVSAPPRAA